MIDGALLTMRKGKVNYGWERSLKYAHKSLAHMTYKVISWTVVTLIAVKNKV